MNLLKQCSGCPRNLDPRLEILSLPILYKLSNSRTRSRFPLVIERHTQKKTAPGKKRSKRLKLGSFQVTSLTHFTLPTGHSHSGPYPSKTTPADLKHNSPNPYIGMRLQSMCVGLARNIFDKVYIKGEKAYTEYFCITCTFLYILCL